MPARVCHICYIAFPNTDEYRRCLGCRTLTMVRAKSPHKDFKTRAFEAYYAAREVDVIAKGK